MAKKLVYREWMLDFSTFVPTPKGVKMNSKVILHAEGQERDCLRSPKTNIEAYRNITFSFIEIVIKQKKKMNKHDCWGVIAFICGPSHELDW